MTRRDDSRRRDLQVDRALGLATREQEQELRAFRLERRQEPDSYELAAAALQLAFGSVRGELPKSIRQRIVQDGIDRLGSPQE